MSAARIHRYITREVLVPTLLCLVIFTLLMVMGRAYQLAGLVIDKGVSPADILILLATLLPKFFSFSLPLAFLMGIMIGFGRLSADSESVAFKSAGIGLARMSIPVFGLAVICGLLTATTELWAKPWGYRAFATKSYEIASQKATLGLQPRVFMRDFHNLVLYANEVDARRNQLQGLFIVEKKPASTAWVFADSGSIVSDAASQTVTIRLHDGVIHRQQEGTPDSLQLIQFRNYDVRPAIATLSNAAERLLKPKEMSTVRLWHHLAGTADPFERRKLQAELHGRLISPLASLLFVLFGLPFSMQSQRTGRSGGFVMGLLIFIGYYFITSTAFTLTRDAAVPPWLTFWLPQAILIFAGTSFFYQSSREKPNRLLGWFDQTLYIVQKRMRKREDS